MNYKVVLSYFLVIGFLLCLVFAYIKYSDSAMETENDKLRQNIVSALEKEILNLQTQIDNIKSGSVSSTPDNASIDSAIQNFIQNKPEVIATSLENFYKQKSIDAQNKAIEEGMSILLKDLSSGAIKTFAGKVDAPIKIVEFFDYSCGFCAKMLESNSKILASNPDTALIFIELPMLGAESMEATRFATAVSMLDSTKYLQFQIQLFNSKMPKNRDNMLQMATNVGIDAVALQKILSDEESMRKIEERIKSNTIIFNTMKLQGTPTYVIGNTVLVGAVSVDKIQEAIDNTKVNKQ